MFYYFCYCSKRSYERSKILKIVVGFSSNFVEVFLVTSLVPTVVPEVFFCTLTYLNLLFEPNISVCILVATGERYGALSIVSMYVCMCLKVSVKYAQLVRVFVFC